MAQQATGPTWTRILTIALYLFFASLPALSFAVFYSCLWPTELAIIFNTNSVLFAYRGNCISWNYVMKDQIRRCIFFQRGSAKLRVNHEKWAPQNLIFYDVISRTKTSPICKQYCIKLYYI